MSRAAVVLVAVLVYSNTFGSPFYFDDSGSITDNASVHDLWNLRQVLSPPVGGFTVEGRPIVNLSFAINYAIGGTGVTGYHIANLLIHVLGALTLLSLVRRTLLLDSMRQTFGRHATALATLVALAWAAHPLETESVTYISQRAESLASLFYLLTLYCSLRGAAGGRAWLWQAAAVGACALGMGSKEMVVTAPVVVLLYDRAFVAGSLATALRRRWPFYVALCATWGVLAWLLVQTFAQGRTALQGAAITSWQYARTEFGVILHYLALAVWPSHAQQCFDYCLPIANSASEIALNGAAVAVLVALTCWLLWRNRPAGFAAACFFLILSPTSSVVPIRDAACEHRMYLALAAVAALAVLGTYWAWRVALARSLAWEPPKAPPAVVPLAAVAAVVAVLCVLSHSRNEDFRVPRALWTDTLSKRPNSPRAHYSMGMILMEEGNSQAAMGEFTRTIEIGADNCTDALLSRGALLIYDGQYAQALTDSTRAMARQPGNPKAYLNQGLALFRMGGHDDEALRDFDRAIALKADYALAYYNRGTLYHKRGDLAAAVGDYNRAISLKGDMALAYRNRAECFWSFGNYDRAWADIRTCRNLNCHVSDDLVRHLEQDSGRTE